MMTPQEAVDFVAAGDPEMDADWFWAQLDVTPEAMFEIARWLSRVLRIPDVAAVMMILETGARFGARPTKENG